MEVVKEDEVISACQVTTLVKLNAHFSGLGCFSLIFSHLGRRVLVASAVLDVRHLDASFQTYWSFWQGFLRAEKSGYCVERRGCCLLQGELYQCLDVDEIGGRVEHKSTWWR
jgi:hypothetical protein